MEDGFCPLSAVPQEGGNALQDDRECVVRLWCIAFECSGKNYGHGNKIKRSASLFPYITGGQGIGGCFFAGLQKGICQYRNTNIQIQNCP